MNLNLKKCKYMPFARKKLLLYKYNIHNCNLEQVDTYVDLGVTLDPKLRFNLHINVCVNKAKGVLGFIKRWAKEFDDPYVTKTLYVSLVRPILEYASVVWNPQYNCYIEKIESVQKQFLLFALRNLRWNPSLNIPPYEHRLKLINLPTLMSRRTMLNVTFLIKLTNGNLISEHLLYEMNFNIPNRRSRYYIHLKLNMCRSNYAQNDPFRCMCNDFNQLYSIVNISDSCDQTKLILLNHLNN